jgi:replication factor C large subunit
MNNAVTQMSLFMKPKIILVDEIDGLSGTKDRGGSQALIKAIQKTKFPIVITANDISLSKLSSLIKKTEIIEFNELETKDVFERLKEISQKENLDIDEFILKSLASRSGGDLRAAITDLQTLSIKDIKKEELEVIGDRKREEEISNVLRLIFKSKDLNLINKNMDDIDLDEISSWIGENLVLEYDNSGIEKAYDSLSKSNVFKGRIMRWQYWRYLVYQRFLISMGVALAKTKKNSNFVKYKRPRKGLMIWQANMRNVERKAMSEKLANYCKVSNKKAFRDIYPQVNSFITEDYLLAEYND